MFALWRVCRGEPIYQAKTAAPYAATYFNWAFYKTYALWSRPHNGPGEEAVMIFWARILTAAAAGAGILLSTFFFRRILQNDSRWTLAPALALFVFSGPTVGWWLVTIRPDVGALAAETTGVWLFLHWNRTRPHFACFAAAGAFYLAWSFKPTYITALSAICLFLGYRQRWSDLARLTVSMVVLWSVTLSFGGVTYRASIRDTATNNAFYPSQGLTNFLASAKTAAPLIIILALSMLSKKKPAVLGGATNLATDAAAIGLIGTVLSAALLLVASSKLGAAPNYFLPTFFMVSLWAVGNLGARDRPLPALGFGLAAVAVQLGMVLGVWGILDLNKQSDSLAQKWTLFATQPEPRFSADYRLNFPWLNPGSPTLMPAYNYFQDRYNGVAFANGGIGGMIEAQKFKTLLLPAETSASFDHGSLANYQQAGHVEGYTIFSLKNQMAAPL
jgi:hypothetical protein